MKDQDALFSDDACEWLCISDSMRLGRHGIDGNRTRHRIGCGNRTQRPAPGVEGDHLERGGTRNVDCVSHARYRNQAACEVERRTRR